jgi:phage N-6-adenine-methyltransferase
MAKSSDERETPQEFFEEINKTWAFKLDAAALSTNAKCETYLGPDHPIGLYRDGLEADWHKLTDGPVWLNPPYSRGELVKWLAKCEKEAAAGITTVVLLPVDTSTQWFHRYVQPRIKDVVFLQGRLTFKGTPLGKNGKPNKAKFANMLVVFNGEKKVLGEPVTAPGDKLVTWVSEPTELDIPF